MSVRTTSKAMNSAISSRASEDGALPCDLPDGVMTDLFGQEVVPASRLAPLEKGRRNRMSATYGRIGMGSSASQSLQSCLESRLKQRLPLVGWMIPLLIWKRKATPARRRYCQAMLLERVIEETGFGLLPTPEASLGHSPFSQQTMFLQMEGKTRKSGDQIGSSLKWHPFSVKFLRCGWINPKLTSWMMGYSFGHLSCAPTEMRLIHMSPLNSSKPTENAAHEI